MQQAFAAMVSPVTLEDVARHAGVSAATVSRALTGSVNVRAETRARVVQAAEVLGYRPDIHARTLARGQSHTLGMIVSNLKNPFFLDVFQALETEAHRRGFELMVANTDYRPDQLSSSVHAMLGRRLAGLAVIVSEMDEGLLSQFEGLRVPVVFYDVGLASPHATRIKTDYARGTRRVVEYLHALGHRRLGFVGHHPGLEPLGARHQAFRAAVERCGPEVQSAMVADEDGPAGGLTATQQLLASGFDPTAIVCVNDFMALGAMKALREAGRRIPEEVSVAGFDNIGLAEFASPPLTTVNVPRQRIGLLVAEALMPDGDGSLLWGREVRIEPELIIRDSTGPPPGGARARPSNSLMRNGGSS
jgi:DNA-binding LacI/PurR family transcriptional regulator